MSITFLAIAASLLTAGNPQPAKTVDVCRSHLDQSGPTAGSSNP